jgi:two-component system, NtrC family, nitrogen regulation sensor histidine kinase NtrY
MSFRTKLLFVVLLTIFASVSVVAYAVTHYTQAAFEAMDAERTEALVAQFKKEFVQRGEEIAHQAKNIAEANLTERMAIDLSRPNADQSLYVRDAVGTAQEHGLDYVEFVNYDGVLISSAQFPARVGYKHDWVTSAKDWNETPAFLKKEELPDGVSLSLSVVRTNNTVADKSLYIIGGHRLDKNFLASLVLPTGMRPGEAAWEPFTRFVLAQDAGVAIKGPGRIDLFCGTGDEAERLAGSFKEQGEIYFLLKK